MKARLTIPSHGESYLNSKHVPDAVETIILAMRMHSNDISIQCNGCRTLALFQGASQMSNDLLVKAADHVLGVLETHADNYKVTASVCGCFRQFLQPQQLDR